LYPIKECPPPKVEGVYLGVTDDVDFVGDGPEDQHEPDARSAQPRDQRHLRFMKCKLAGISFAVTTVFLHGGV